MTLFPCSPKPWEGLLSDVVLILNIKYSKCPKILNTLFHAILAKLLLFMQLFLEILSGMANIIDPDQTAPKGKSDLGLHCLHMPFCQKP